jgi:hypothetical protein
MIDSPAADVPSPTKTPDSIVSPDLGESSSKSKGDASTRGTSKDATLRMAASLSLAIIASQNLTAAGGAADGSIIKLIVEIIEDESPV